MPQRYSRYAYGPDEETLAQLGGPFYDPYSKRGNVGYALRQAVNMMVAKKKEEQDTAKEQAKADWEQKFKEAELALRGRQVAVQERPERPERPPAKPDAMEMAEELIKRNPDRYPGPDALNIAMQDVYNMQKTQPQPRPPRVPYEFEIKAQTIRNDPSLSSEEKNDAIKALYGLKPPSGSPMEKQIEYLMEQGMSFEQALDRIKPTKTGGNAAIDMALADILGGGKKTGKAKVPPEGAPAGTTFVRTDPDGVDVWKFPNGKEMRYVK